MQVYRAFFKVIKRNLPQLMIYVIVFLFFAVLLSSVNSSPVNTSFSETKKNMVFINNDINSELVKGLENYLGKKANFVNIENNTKKLLDALFFRKVEYILKVPKGFTDDLINGKDTQLEKIIVPDSASSIYIDNIINKYLNTAKIYINNIENITLDELISYINNDMSQTTQVNVNSNDRQSTWEDSIPYFFNYLAYSLFAILILGVGAVMLVFNNTDLKKRNLCSPIKLRSMSLQLFFGNLSFAFFTWFILVIVSFIKYGSYMFTANGLLLLLNSIIFTSAVLSISFLIGNLVKSNGAMSAATNVVSLGCCFISGVFVPQALLGDTVLNMASFTPAYWYVKNNNEIVNIVNFNLENLMPIFYNMLIVIGFAVTTLAISLVVIKQKRLSA